MIVLVYLLAALSVCFAWSAGYWFGRTRREGDPLPSYPIPQPPPPPIIKRMPVSPITELVIDLNSDEQYLVTYVPRCKRIQMSSNELEGIHYYDED